jgi:hypothetical protein
VIHPLPDCSDAGPWRKVVGVALVTIELKQSIIIRMELAGDLKTLTELYGEIVVDPCDVNEVLLRKIDPAQVAYVIDCLFIGELVKTVVCSTCL